MGRKGPEQFADNVVADLPVRTEEERHRLYEAFATVPRSYFIDSAFIAQAYDDNSIPIGYGQTISKPSTIALMLAHLALEPGEKVLEIGAGSGYVTALLAQLGVRVCAIERIGALAQRARRRLDRLGFSQVLLRAGDGTRGWPSEAPFDAIVISAAFSTIPESLFAQVSEYGRIMAPLTSGSDIDDQRLVLWRRTGNQPGNTEPSELYDLGPCKFVMGTSNT